jgi:hypothetical protein
MTAFAPIIHDTLNGAIIISIFDFFACFIVLLAIGLIIKAASYLINIKKPATQKET